MKYKCKSHHLEDNGICDATKRKCVLLHGEFCVEMDIPDDKPLTVAEALNGMNVEEKAKICCLGCPPQNIVGKCETKKTCEECWIVYLSSPYAKEDAT